MARDLDAMAVIVPFEVKCYADTTLPVESVGHPFVAPGHAEPVRYDPAGPVLLLPGSRKQAVARIFPVLLAGFRAFGRGEAVVLYPSDDILQVLNQDEDVYGVESFATHHLSQDEAPGAYADFREKKDGMVKVVFNP